MIILSVHDCLKLSLITTISFKRLQITRSERMIGVKLHSIVAQSSQSSTTTVWVDTCEN